MAHHVVQWPLSVYPAEIADECPEALAVIDVLILAMSATGPSPEGYSVKNLGKNKGGLWQINLKVEKKQIRILYAPYGDKIVLFRIHKKSSPQEQKRAYALAQDRKFEYEEAIKKAALEAQKREKNGGSRTVH